MKKMWLECPKCKTTFSPVKPHSLCTCGSPLLVQYNLHQYRELDRDEVLIGEESSLWRYENLLPVVDREHRLTLGEGWTPLLEMKRLGSKLDLPHLFVKDEGLNPTGTFKARGAAIGVSRAKELGLKDLCMATAGNAGGAWAAYGARGGIPLHLVMPVDAPEITKIEGVMAGASVYLVQGLLSHAGSIVGKAAKKYGWFDVSTLKEPYRIEGKKTMGYEIVEQLGFRVPDVIIYPCGGGVGLIGIWKALQEMEELGWIKGERPRMVAVQASGCAPIVKAFQEEKKEALYWEGAETIAGGLRVPQARGDFLILEALYESGGMALSVSDESMREAMSVVMESEGLFFCPEGAATVAAVKRLREDGWLSKEDMTVLLNTGTGLKYPSLVRVDVPVLKREETL